jgi:ribosomal protein S18 acetylase RimI-like enzyme
MVPQYQLTNSRRYAKNGRHAMTAQVSIRNALPSDFDAVIDLDLSGAAEEKSAYWRGVFDRYVVVGRNDRIFLVAELAGEAIGFIVGEVRAWEFGSPPCGWVFALTVSPRAREIGVGQLMFEEMCQRLKKAGVTTVRTMVDRENKLTLSFFRSQGLRTGRYIELEKLIDGD